MSDRLQSDPLADLERRWAEERNPQLTLHLAEEYRQVGNDERAVEVLRQGLEHHPTHVAARVALGRLLLESGRASAASAALEPIVDDDPTHLVANKLLVKASLELGEAERARNRLGLYETLNPGDPEIQKLEAQIERVAARSEPPAGDGEGRAATDSSAQASPEPAAAGAGEKEPESDEDGETDDPFSDLWTGPDRVAYQTALAEEGIFELAGVSPGEVPDEATDEAQEATVTLGRLYLEQGHLTEAERIFRTVLEADPGNPDASKGLSEALGERSSLKATDLVPSDLLAAAQPAERKRLVLESYRERLRSSTTRG
jgi:predicted Zn-dependent protease